MKGVKNKDFGQILSRPQARGGPTYIGHYKVCPKLVIHCDFYKQGCNDKFPREDSEKHNEECAARHVKLLKEEVESDQKSKNWVDKTIHWKIPMVRIRQLLATGRLQSKRVPVGQFLTYLELKDEGERRSIRVKICIEEPPQNICPMIDRMKIAVGIAPPYHTINSPHVNYMQDNEVVFGRKVHFASLGIVGDSAEALRNVSQVAWPEIQYGFYHIEASFRLNPGDYTEVGCVELQEGGNIS